MKIAFDTNALVYAEGLNGGAKQSSILNIIVAIPKAQQDDFTWGGITVVNSFAATPSPLLDEALRK